jgi:hypothetical protein
MFYPAILTVIAFGPTIALLTTVAGGRSIIACGMNQGYHGSPAH